MSEKSRSGANKAWFDEDVSPDKAAKLLWGHVSALRTNDLAPYRARVLRNMRLYQGTQQVNGTDSSISQDNIRYNVIRMAVDTAAAILVAARTLPFAQTRGANWKLRRKATVLNRVLQQQFQDIGVFEASQQRIVDALVCELGAVKFFEDPTEDGATAGCERCLPLSLVWDPAEASNGAISQLYEVRLVNRDTLIELYARKEVTDNRTESGKRVVYDQAVIERIKKASGPSATDMTDFQLTRVGSANQVVVIEGWRLPSSAKSKDGKHGVYISTGELSSEVWDRPRFPFGFLKGWSPRALGFTGTSLVELLEPAQRRIQELKDFTDACQNLASVPRGFIFDGSMVEAEQINNLPFQMIKVTGSQAPVFQTFDGTPHDLEQAVMMVKAEALEMIGISQQQVQGQVDTGLTSAVAQRAREDIQSKRHVINLRYVEQMYLMDAHALMDTNNAIAKNHPNFSIDRAARGSWLESSKWKDVMVSSTDAKLGVFPVSQLVGSVASQYETTQGWVDRGWCDQNTAKMLAGNPDTEGQADEDDVHERFAHYLCDKILDGEKVALDPVLDLDIFAVVASGEYLEAQMDNAPEPVLAEFRRVLAVCQGRAKAVTAATGPAAPPPQAPVGPPVMPQQAALPMQ